MKRFILAVAATVVCLGNLAWAQPKEKYEGKTLIVCKWGEKPGECQTRMWEGDGDWPRSFVVDDKEHVYVLDHLNNRVQHYDEAGKLLGVIPIQSYQLCTEEEAEENQGREYSVFSIEGMWLINGGIYAMQDEKHQDTHKKTLLEMHEGSFVPVVSTTTKTLVEKRMTVEYRNADIREHLNTHQKFKTSVKKTKFGDREEFFYDGLRIGSAYFDRGNNVWIVSRGRIRKYGHQGTLLFETPLDNMASHDVSNNGNLYLMNLYSTKPGDPAHLGFEDYWEGVDIKKFTPAK
ncbi:MAG: hypothetical protein WC986_14140 [Elusimicrobiota bacterium]|jgi:hypothetical protein